MHKRSERHQSIAVALLIHALTASGVAMSMLAALAAWRLDWPAFFSWLGVALLIDAIDGPLARKFSVQTKLPQLSGTAIDFIVDYINYAFLPALALAISGIAPSSVAVVLAIIIVVSSALYFGDTRMKLQDNAFRGFPCLWNGVVFSLFVIQPHWQITVTLIVLFTVLTFIPVAFVHPIRVTRWQELTLPVTVSWGFFAIVSVWYSLSPGLFIKLGLVGTSVYLCSVAAVQQLTERFRSRMSQKKNSYAEQKNKVCDELDA